MSSIKMEAYFKEGKFHFPYLNQFEKHLFNYEGKKLLITIEEYPEKIEPNHHGYYRIVNKWLSESTETFGGWHPDDIHDFAKMKFLSETVIYKIIEKGKEVEYAQKVTPSLADISKKRMSKFMNQWFDYLAYEHNIEVPPPDHFKFAVQPTETDGIHMDDHL